MTCLDALDAFFCRTIEGLSLALTIAACCGFLLGSVLP